MAQIEATKFKLAEAQFFFGKLAELGRRTAVFEPAAFRFYLSAFLSASRSVTFVLQAEAKDQYDAWFPQWMTTLTTDQAALLKNFNSERIASVHQRGARIEQDAEPIPFNLWLADAAREGVQVFRSFGSAPGSVDRLTWIFRFDGLETEAVQAASGYLALIERLVGDFESRHAEG